MNKVFKKIIEKLEDAKSNVPVNRLLDDIINDKPKELGQLMAYNKAIEIVKQEAEKYKSTKQINCSSEDLISRSVLNDKLKKWKFANEERGYDTAKDLVQEMIDLVKEQPSVSANNGWIPVSERLPEKDKYILLSFLNFSIPCVGRYNEDENGGAFYIGDEDETCVSQELFVNAWQPLLEPYQQNECSENECPYNDGNECPASDGCAGYQSKFVQQCANPISLEKLAELHKKIRTI